MPITYYPSIGEALWCDYAGLEPEMIKRRLVVVVSPRACQRQGLVTVVPISASAPEVVEPWHVKLGRDPYPRGTAREVWAKCDMVNTVCFQRLAGYHFRWNGQRKYQKMQVSLQELNAIRIGMAASLGLRYDL